MRRVVLGVMLAAGAVLPGIAAAQEGRPDNRRNWAAQRDASGGQERRGDRGPAAPAPQPQAQVQAQAPVQTRSPQFGGERQNRDGGRFESRGDAPTFQQQEQRRAEPRGFQQNGFRDRRGSDRPNGDDRGDRFAGRSQKGAPFAPGSGGYRPQGDFNRGQGYVGGSDYRPSSRDDRSGGWNRGWRGDDRFNWGGYRAQNRYAFHLPRYAAPRSWGYGYRRLSPGFTLSSVLFDQGFWIDEPYNYRLPPAYGPYRWVRYYNDALLVDIRSGYVVDTVYDIFW